MSTVQPWLPAPGQRVQTGMTCDHCDKPILFGEMWCWTHVGAAGWDGARVVMVPTPEFEKPFTYHAVCAAVLAHDAISKDECGEPDEGPCAGGCGAMVDADSDIIAGHYYCQHCVTKLGGGMP